MILILSSSISDPFRPSILDSYISLIICINSGGIEESLPRLLAGYIIAFWTRRYVPLFRHRLPLGHSVNQPLQLLGCRCACTCFSTKTFFFFADMASLRPLTASLSSASTLTNPVYTSRVVRSLARPAAAQFAQRRTMASSNHIPKIKVQ